MASTANDPRRAWRSPEGRPLGGTGGRPAGGLSARLARVFEQTEDENKQIILQVVADGAPHRRLLDAGCYSGAFTMDLAAAAQATTVCGVEWLEEHADLARARGVEVERADLNEGLPYPDASFDLVHANQVIEHLRGTDAFMRELRRVCAPGGRVVLSTNNLASWHNIASLVLGFQPMPNHVSDEVHVGNPLDPRRSIRHADVGQTHLRVFTTRALTELAAAHGLAVERVAMNGYYPLAPRFARVASRVDGRHAAFMVVVLRPVA